jgi:flagellar basal-body rod modification protein FlgD
MAVSAVSAATADASVGAGRTRLAENFETFLALLTTQLKNQDPLSPMDGNQFTQQLVQMTGVEQQLLSNQLLTKLVTQGGATLDGAVNLIGKTVTADRRSAELTGKGAEWTYELPTAAADAQLTIKDSTGQVVRQAPAPALGAGRHTFTWDGTLANGFKAPPGTYSLSLSAKATGGKAINTPVNVVGIATAAETIDGETWLTVGSTKVKLSAVTSVRQPS